VRGRLAVRGLPQVLLRCCCCSRRARAGGGGGGGDDGGARSFRWINTGVMMRRTK